MRMLQRLTSGGTLLLLALIVGAATTVGTVTWLRTQSQAAARSLPADTTADAVEIVVARESLVAGTRLAMPMLRVISVPRAIVPDQAITSLDDASGQVIRYPLAAGEPILGSKLVGAGSGGVGLAYAIPDGMRAVSVAFSEVMGAGGLVVPGDHVDVLVHTEYGRLFAPGQAAPVAAGEHAPIVMTALQDVIVLAVGQEYAQGLALGDDRSARSDGVDAQPAARSVTLAVSSEQAQRLFLAAQEGQLGLALRGFGDEDALALTPLLRFEVTSGSGTDLAAAHGTGN